MPMSPAFKHYGADDPRMADYVDAVFGISDPLLDDIRERAERAGMPTIHVSHFDGRHLSVLAQAIGARKVIEIGTLAGLSGICLARALAPGGHLHTFEFEPLHANVAQESFQRAGVDHQVTIHVGPALQTLPHVEGDGPFDLVFIDADKANYPHYLQWAARHLRVGGVVLIDNAFAWGLVVTPDGEIARQEDREAKAYIHQTNQSLAGSGIFASTMLPTGEGLAMGVKVREP